MEKCYAKQPPNVNRIRSRLPPADASWPDMKGTVLPSNFRVVIHLTHKD